MGVECLVSVYPPALLNQWLDVYPGKVNEDYNYTNNAEKTDTDKHSHYKVSWGKVSVLKSIQKCKDFLFWLSYMIICPSNVCLSVYCIPSV